MKILYLFLIIFIIFILISFTKKGKQINMKIEIITFFIFNEFKALSLLINLKKTTKKYKERHFCNLTKKLNTSLVEKYNSHNIVKDKCFYLCNHRSWADFWIDYDIVKGGCYISRNIIKKILFGTSAWAEKANNILFFDRGDTRSKYELYKKILEKINKRNMIIYPEGTRQTSNVSKPLKIGLIKLAYENNIPLQVVITSNKEKIFSQKKLEYNKNIKCTYYASEKIKPSEYKSLDKFIKGVQEIWDESWNEIYN